MDKVEWAATVVAVTVGVIIAFDWIPTPLNRNIRRTTVRDRLPSTLIHGGVGATLAALLYLHHDWAVVATMVWYSVVLTAAIFNWWIPYFFNAHYGEISPDIYLAEYTENVRILPPIQDHVVVPDVQHTLIHACVLACVVTCLVAFV